MSETQRLKTRGITDKDLIYIRSDGSIEPFISLRDQFAMAALTGLVGNHDLIGAVLGVANNNNVEAGEVYARMAYEQADAMLKAREGEA